MNKMKGITIFLICIGFFAFAEEDPKNDSIALDDFATVYSNEIASFETGEVQLTAEEFIAKMSSLEYEIQMDYNYEVKRYIDMFATSWQTKLKEVMTLSKLYFPIYEEILDKNDMPLEIVYLSVIESALNPEALSRSGALGTWQFMRATGRLYKLKIDGSIDERSDINKSTEAACKYLKQMYLQYGDWLVALASYNCGPGNINKAIRNSGGKTTFWEIYPYLPRQTQNYVPKFIAMSYLMNFGQDHGIQPSYPVAPLRFESVTVTSQHHFKAIRDVLGISINDFNYLNKQFKLDRLPNGVESATLWLPADKVKMFIDKESTIVALSETAEYQIKSIEVVVKKGESLPVIARRNHCTVSELKSWNNIRSNVIHPGQKLVIQL